MEKKTGGLARQYGQKSTRRIFSRGRLSGVGFNDPFTSFLHERWRRWFRAVLFSQFYAEMDGHSTQRKRRFATEQGKRVYIASQIKERRNPIELCRTKRDRVVQIYIYVCVCVEEGCYRRRLAAVALKKRNSFIGSGSIRPDSFVTGHVRRLHPDECFHSLWQSSSVWTL